MSKKNTDFFDKKKIWSEIKDTLLGCYLQPYIQKVIMTRRPIIYVDCFAGRGRFKDGNPGSPILALDIIKNCLSKSRFHRAQVHGVFIELNHADDLEKNLQGYCYEAIIHGKYEENVIELIGKHANDNVFLYIDPYGIKALQYAIFDIVSKMALNSCEILINLNSFGFIREACRALGVQYDLDFSEELVEYDPTIFESSEKSIEELSKIAGGDYWIEIIRQLKAGNIDGYVAERQFASEYSKTLHGLFKYVLNMPIRLKEGQRPKYRMVHATNHESGCLIMNDNMCKRWEAIQHIQTGGQMSFLEQTVENDALNYEGIQNGLSEHTKRYRTFTDVDIVLANYISENELQCQRRIYCSMLGEMEKATRIIVERNPAVRNGKPTSFWTSDKSNTVRIKWNQNV